MNVTTEDLIKITEDTIDAIEKRGWTTRTLVNTAGNVCLLGGLGIALANDPFIYRTHTPQARSWLIEFNSFLNRYTREALTYYESGVANWNNSRESVDEVIEGLRNFIAELKGRAE